MLAGVLSADGVGPLPARVGDDECVGEALGGGGGGKSVGRGHHVAVQHVQRLGRVRRRAGDGERDEIQTEL